MKRNTSEKPVGSVSLDKAPVSGPVHSGDRVESYACLLAGNVP